MDYIKIGLISKPQGIKGELKIFPMTDDINRFLNLKEVYLEKGTEYIKYGVKGARVGSDAAYLFLEHIYDRTAAEGLRGQSLYVERRDAIILPKGKYFIFDIVGCEVFTKAGIKLGVVTEVMQPGANDVYVVKGETEILLPAVKAFIADVDIPHKKITVNGEMLEEVSVDED